MSPAQTIDSRNHTGKAPHTLSLTRTLAAPFVLALVSIGASGCNAAPDASVRISIPYLHPSAHGAFLSRVPSPETIQRHARLLSGPQYLTLAHGSTRHSL